MIKGIKYLSPTFDHSGYGEASRCYIFALNDYTEIPMSLQRLQFEATTHDYYGEEGRVLLDMMGKKIPEYNVKIMHATPEHYPLYKEEGKINIGFLYWETSHVPPSWTEWIKNDVDAQFVVCEYTKQSLIDSGVDPEKIYIVPPLVSIKDFDFGVGKMDITNVEDDWFKFYSIFQWTERKNPWGLLKAYFSEFRRSDPVIFILKTYLADINDMDQKREIVNYIQSIKFALSLKGEDANYPRLALVSDLLTRQEIFKLHNTCDCYVSAHRSEGIGYPLMESFLFGNPVITSTCGGNMEFTNKENSYLADHFLTPVFNMPWIPWYSGDMYWGETDLHAIKKHMRHVYNNRDEAKQKALLGRKFIMDNYDAPVAIKKFVETVEEVVRKVS